MTFAAAYEDPPVAWGVGRVVVGDELIPWPVSPRDIEDETESMVPRLAALGLDDDGLVLIVSLLSDTIHVYPFEQAAGRLGALYSSADRSPFDAYRTASLIRQLKPTVVMGIDHRVLDGLADAGRDLYEVFAPVPAIVAVDDDAATRLAATGLEVRRWLTIGPTSAVQPLDDDALVYDPMRWEIESSNPNGVGELLITNLVDRLTPCDRLRTGRHGEVLEPGLLRAD
jgi:hypothetical protein